MTARDIRVRESTQLTEAILVCLWVLPCRSHEPVKTLLKDRVKIRRNLCLLVDGLI
ncbi:hypothetical protein FRAHR75_160025 [Frankia sp. Hr75.2]|nr:hypothetical protein FRAHR75_160025 [Frankia sp. Hr75.2]